MNHSGRGFGAFMMPLAIFSSTSPSAFEKSPNVMLRLLGCGLCPGWGIWFPS